MLRKDRSLVRQCSLLVAALVASAGPTLVFADGSVSVTLGSRRMTDDLWGNLEEAEDQAVFGADVEFGKPDWPIHIEAGLHTSAFDLGGLVGSGVRVRFWDLGVGVRMTWKAMSRGFSAYGGGGIVEAVPVGEEGFLVGDRPSTAGYVTAGVSWRLPPTMMVGVASRGVFGTRKEQRFLGSPRLTTGDTDYYQIGLSFGVTWPARN